MNAVQATDLDEVVIVIEDAADLTAKELEQERKAQLEELKKRSWMSHSAEELAGRIPVSVFAMGSLRTDD
jgi:Tfp pilus assembly protein PilN